MAIPVRLKNSYSKKTWWDCCQIRSFCNKNFPRGTHTHPSNNGTRSCKDQVEILKILNGYENIDRSSFSHVTKIEELEDISKGTV